MERYLRLNEAAKLIGFSENTLRRWLRAGRGPAHIKSPGGVYLFKISDLEAWEKSLEVRSSEIKGEKR